MTRVLEYFTKYLFVYTYMISFPNHRKWILSQLIIIIKKNIKLINHQPQNATYKMMLVGYSRFINELLDLLM
jgi:hypothetical protein